MFLQTSCCVATAYSSAPANNHQPAHDRRIIWLRAAFTLKLTGGAGPVRPALFRADKRTSRNEIRLIGIHANAVESK